MKLNQVNFTLEIKESISRLFVRKIKQAHERNSERSIVLNALEKFVSINLKITYYAHTKQIWNNARGMNELC